MRNLLCTPHPLCLLWSTVFYTREQDLRYLNKVTRRIAWWLCNPDLCPCHRHARHFPPNKSATFAALPTANHKGWPHRLSHRPCLLPTCEVVSSGSSGVPLQVCELSQPLCDFGGPPQPTLVARSAEECPDTMTDPTTNRRRYRGPYRRRCSCWRGHYRRCAYARLCSCARRTCP
jgi:hypothetical protein